MSILIYVLIGSVISVAFVLLKKQKTIKGSLLTGLKGLSKNFSDAFGATQTLKNSGSELKSNAGELRELARNLDYSADENSKKILESSESLGQMDKRITNLEEQFSKSLNSLENFEKRITEVTSKNSEVAEMMHKLNLIGEQMEVIGSITFQTKILSFNAAIEAQRADAVSRHGFNVVAKEIKKLADHTEKAAKQIDQSFADAKLFFKTYQSESSEAFKQLVEGVSETRTDIQNAEKELLDLTHCKSKALALNSKILGTSESLKECSSQTTKLAIKNESISVRVEGELKKLQQNVEDMNADIACLSGSLTGAKIVDIDPKDAISKLGDFAALVDVRGKAEFNDELGHIKGSRLLTIDENFSSGLKAFKEQKDMPVLFICRSGGRSARAARLAQQAGFKQVYNLKGGMLAWNESGQETELDTITEYKKSA